VNLGRARGELAFERVSFSYPGAERPALDAVGLAIAPGETLALVGPSGSGKSSLLRAGLLPALRSRFVLLRPTRSVAAEITDAVEGTRAGDRVVVAVDQFEELFADAVSEQERRAFVHALVEAAWDPERRVIVLLALRADHFGRLTSYPQLADLAGSHVLIGGMSRTELRRAVRKPAELAGLDVEQELVDALVDDVAGETGGLPLLSTALVELWEARDGPCLTLHSYTALGGVHGIVERHAEAAYRSFDAEEQRLARLLFLRLVSGGGDETPMRRRLARAELPSSERTEDVLATLVDRRLVVAVDDGVELVHEALIERWPRLRAWLDEDAHGRRLHAQLAAAASAWAARGRDPDELYRGARLAAAVDWADASGDELSPDERAFLTASRRAQTRQTRRLRGLLAAAVLLLVVAIGAGVAALVSRASANRAATSAIAQRLGAQALSEQRLDRSLLLAREGIALNDTTATRSNLLGALLRSPAALMVLHPDGNRVVDHALSDNGRILAVRTDSGNVAFFDTRTGRAADRAWHGTGNIVNYGAIARPVRDLAFSPDGRTLAVGDTDGHVPTIALVDPRSGTVRVRRKSRGAATAEVAYGSGGDVLVTGEVTSGRLHPPPEVLVLRRAVDAAPLRRSTPIPGGRLVGFVPGTRDLLVTSARTSRSCSIHGPSRVCIAIGWAGRPRSRPTAARPPSGTTTVASRSSRSAPAG